MDKSQEHRKHNLQFMFETKLWLWNKVKIKVKIIKPKKNVSVDPEQGYDLCTLKDLALMVSKKMPTLIFVRMRKYVDDLLWSWIRGNVPKIGIFMIYLTHLTILKSFFLII